MIQKLQVHVTLYPFKNVQLLTTLTPSLVTNITRPKFGNYPYPFYYSQVTSQLHQVSEFGSGLNLLFLESCAS